jgi:hypothetical protein
MDRLEWLADHRERIADEVSAERALDMPTALKRGQAMIAKLERIESGNVARDFREVISGERQKLMAMRARRDYRACAVQIRECERVLEMWRGHY